MSNYHHLPFAFEFEEKAHRAGRLTVATPPAAEGSAYQI